MTRFKFLHTALAISAVLCLLLSACSSKKTGTVQGLVMLTDRPGELLAHIKLEDGTEILALPKVAFQTDSGSGWELAKEGQTVEVEPIKDSKDWKIVRIISRPPGDTGPPK